MIYSLIIEAIEEETYFKFPCDMSVFLVKFPSAVALHLFLYPEAL